MNLIVEKNQIIFGVFLLLLYKSYIIYLPMNVCMQETISKLLYGEAETVINQFSFFVGIHILVFIILACQ